MKEKRLLILGGYGNTGRPLAELLLGESDAKLVIAGRDIRKAQTLAADLNRKYSAERVKGLCVDAADRCFRNRQGLTASFPSSLPFSPL